MRGKPEIVCLQWAVKETDGTTRLVNEPWSEIPDWARTLLWPEWNHPGDCECHPCWQRKECTING